MKSRAHAVSLAGTQVGVITQAGDVARFTFDVDYWERLDRKVLGLWFEDNPHESPRASLRLPPWFSNLLPEGRLREWIALDRGVSADREMELLLRVGRDLPGAVTVAEEGSEDFDATWEEVEAARLDAGEDRLWKFSLAGVGLKFSMLASGDKLTLPAGHQLGDWIVKMPEPAHARVPLNEFVIMGLARSVGIAVPETRLVDRSELGDLPDSVWANGEETAYAIKRFDRVGESRIHAEDLAQVRGFYPHEKYDGSFETVAALLYRGVDIDSLIEFIRRLTFNILVGNGDAHLKNWSVIYPDGYMARLSPAYDLVSTVPYFKSGEEDLGMKFGGSKRFDRLRRYDFLRLANKLDIDPKVVLAAVDETIERFFAQRDQLELLEPLEGFEARILAHAEPIARSLGAIQG